MKNLIEIWTERVPVNLCALYHRDKILTGNPFADRVPLTLIELKGVPNNTTHLGLILSHQSQESSPILPRRNLDTNPELSVVAVLFITPDANGNPLISDAPAGENDLSPSLLLSNSPALRRREDLRQLRLNPLVCVKEVINILP